MFFFSPQTTWTESIQDATLTFLSGYCFTMNNMFEIILVKGWSRHESIESVHSTDLVKKKSLLIFQWTEPMVTRPWTCWLDCLRKPKRYHFAIIVVLVLATHVCLYVVQFVTSVRYLLKQLRKCQQILLK